jgi:hypothetical protein
MPSAFEQTHESKKSGALRGNKAMRPRFEMKLGQKGQAENAIATYCKTRAR